MNDLPRQHILAMIDSYGLDVLDLSRTVESELHLACPDRRAEVDGLVAALRHGVVHYLLVLAEAGTMATMNLPGQVQRLQAEAHLSEAEAQQAVSTWAEIIAARATSVDGKGAWRREPWALHRREFAGLRDVLVVGLAGLLASMLPWLVVFEEQRGHPFFIPVEMGLLGTHTLLNLLGALGGFLGGALGWIFGTPLSLEFRVSGGLASLHRVAAASLAAGLGSFFGLWVGYEQLADVGAFFGPLLGAGLAAFVASIYTFTYRRLGAWDK